MLTKQEALLGTDAQVESKEGKGSTFTLMFMEKLSFIGSFT